MQDGVELALRKRLTSTASPKLGSLNSLLQDFASSRVPDERRLLNGSAFTKRGAYGALSPQLSDPHDHTLKESTDLRLALLPGQTEHKMQSPKNIDNPHQLHLPTMQQCKRV